MNFKHHTKDAVAELLNYLADHEDFKSIKQLKSFTKGDVTALFREMAESLKNESAKEPLISKQDIKQKEFSPNLNRVVSGLSPHEESLLFKSFRIS